MSRRLFFLLAITGLLALSSRARAEMKQYQTRYYTIYTDIDPQDEKEAELRMTRMAEEYHERTKSFAGVIHQRLPFFLFKSSSDYYAAGGMKGSAGVFIGNEEGGKLMAIAGQKSSVQTWHVVQHEGFHQFAAMTIRGRIPTWLNEGLAEYFGEAIWTGDGFVTGVIPPWRLTRLRQEIAGGELKSFDEIAHLSGQTWANQLNIKNYDQAWSMVHFMVHGDNDKYQSSLSQCIREISMGRDPEMAMRQTIATNVGIEDRWKAWWTEQSDDPTADLYAQAAVATMTSFVARAYEQGQSFPDFDAFASAVDAKTLKISSADWLPESLIENNFRLYGSRTGWALAPGFKKQPEVSLKLDDGDRLVGTFTLNGRLVDHVYVTLDDMASVLKKAAALLDEKKKEQARTLVQNALRQYPRSAMLAEAKKFIQSCR